MYLVSIYFDETTNTRIRQYIRQVAESTGNSYMLDGEVPPHITISAFETQREEAVIDALEAVARVCEKGSLTWASVGQFFPYVIYLAPVLNEYLHGVSYTIYDSLLQVEGISISPYYRPFQWLPHTTIGKKLSKEEMQKAFCTLQNSFGMFSGEVVRIGLAKTNPYRDIVEYDL